MVKTMIRYVFTSIGQEFKKVMKKFYNGRNQSNDIDVKNRLQTTTK